MPVIKVISSGSPSQASNQGPHLAAAVMALTLAKASEPPKVHERHKRARVEKIRPRNPNSLTVDQHVFPSKSIERFTNEDGHVSVHDLHRGEVSARSRVMPFFAPDAHGMSLPRLDT
jgi:hypothetical protein